MRRESSRGMTSSSSPDIEYDRCHFSNLKDIEEGRKSIADFKWDVNQSDEETISTLKGMLDAYAKMISDYRMEIEELYADLQYLGELPDLTFGHAPRSVDVYEE